MTTASVRSRWSAFALGGLVFASALSGSACAGQRDPINRVDLGALPKSFFVGPKLDDVSDDPEFYYRTTVVDVSAGAGSESLFTNSDAQPTVRVRWEITQDKLLARLAYELIDGTDGKGTTSAPRGDEPRGPKAPARKTPDGQLVAAFKIEKQFDIRKDYNPNTGEEGNIVVENETDRPWNQRAYMRVDWSQNLVSDAYDLDAISQMGLYGGVQWTPVAYQVEDLKAPDAPVVDLDAGYLDLTNKAFAAPQMIHDEEWGDFPACMLVGQFPRISCNPSEVTMRLAFRRVTDTDYEALDYDGRRMEMFGFFTNDRYGFDRRYGVVDEQWRRFASRWNIWETSHADPVVACATPDTTPADADPHRDADKDGTEDECAAVGRGSRCDVFRQACTKPLRDRRVRMVPWHVNREFPAELFDGMTKVVGGWNDAMRVAILSGRLAECRRTHESGCEDQHGWPQRWSDDFVPPVGDGGPAEVPNVFVLCHNPVDPAVDDPACGKAGTSPRIGDLRYNLITYVVSPQAQAPWGIMVDAEDPLTGEKIAGSVTQYGATLDRASAQLVDIVSLLDGITSPNAFIEGKDVSDWLNSAMDGTRPVLPTGMSAEETASRRAAFDPAAMAPFASPKPGAKTVPANVRRSARMKDLEARGLTGAGNAAIVQRLQKLRGTDIEASLVTPDVAQLAGVDPKASVTASVIQRATPFGMHTPLVQRAYDRRAALGRASRHACRRDGPDGDHVLALARRATKLFGAVDVKDANAVNAFRGQVFQWARQQFASGVYAHEFGHSMGLRHNFAGTFDALNYDRRYWQLRTKDGKVTQPCAPGNADGAACIGPRYDDPITNDEIDGGIGGFATSSVMDYPGDQSLDMYTLGTYDRAALRFGYGGVVDVWAAPGLGVNGAGDAQRKAWELLGFTDPPGLFGVVDMPQPGKTETTNLHYSRYASEFGLVQDCKPDGDSPLGTSCTGAQLDVVDYRDMQDFAPVPAYAAFSSNHAAVDAQGRVRRGYMFSSDEFADTGNVPSFRFDAGADSYEQMRFLEAAYENRYVLDSFRRGRTMFDSDSVVNRVHARYLDTLQLLSKTFAFAMVLDVDDPTNPPADIVSDGRFGPLAIGTSVAFDLFARMLTRPEPGAYCTTASDTCPGIQPYGLENNLFVADPYPTPGEITYDFAIPLGRGRYLHNDYDYAQGYYWSDYQKQVGSYYDKLWAVYYLSEAYDSFISNSKEDFVDGRYKNVSFATVYPEQTRRLFAQLVTGDMDVYSPWATAATGTDNGITAASVTYPQWSRSADLGTRPTDARLVDPTYGFEQQLAAMAWGTMFFPTSWSNWFIDDARIVARPTEQIAWPAANTTTYVDPETQTIYRAHSTGLETLFGNDHERSIGARMLEWANNLLVTAYVPQTDANGYILLNTDGTPKLVLVNGKPKLNPDYPGADAALRRYVTNIELMRQLTNTFSRDANPPSP